MMTWLTRISWLDTAQDLDDRALVQQRKEAVEFMTAMLRSIMSGEIEEDVANHPLYRMWYGYEAALVAYAACINLETVRRGYHTRGAMQIDTLLGHVRRKERMEFEAPPWKDDTDVLRSHRSNLIRRFPDEYNDSWRKTPERMPYLWPFVDEDGGYSIFVSKYDRELLASGERVLPKEIRKRVENL